MAKKLSFSLKKTQKISKILFFNLIFFIIFLFIFLGGLEVFLRYQKAFIEKTISAVGIPIFEPNNTNTYHHKPESLAYNGYAEPVPEIKINNIGLRDEIFDPHSTKNDVNILLIGDSFTFGTGVNAKDTFPEILEKNINQDFSNTTKTPNITKTWKVWNAGHIGYSIDNYYLLLKEYSALLKPKMVIINIFVGNDITELKRKKWYFKKNDLIQTKDTQVFANDKNQLESHISKIPFSFAGKWLWDRWGILAHKNGWIDPKNEDPTLTWPVFLPENHPAQDPNLPEYWERFFQIFSLILDWSEKNEIPVFFVLIPMDTQVSAVYEKKYTPVYFDSEARIADRPQNKILEFCKKSGAICFDPLPVFRENPEKEKLYFSHNADPHFDTLGHTILAEFILAKIQKFLDSK